MRGSHVRCTIIYDDYRVSDDGKIWNIRKEFEVTQTVSSDGYATVTLRLGVGRRRTFRVHRLVAEAFIPNPDDKPEVNHIDGVKLNNEASNLEWVTHAENIKHAWDTGLLAPTSSRSKKLSAAHKGKRRGKANHKSKAVRCLTTNKVFESIRQACQFYGTDCSQMYKSLNSTNRYAGRCPSTNKPLFWEYITND